VNEWRQFRGPLLALVLTVALGVAGYTLIERWSLLDALFVTVITVTTVGYGLPAPLSPAGMIFTIVLILVGGGVVLYTLSSLFGWLLAIDWPSQQRRRRMEAALAHLESHFILCGYGRVGRSVADVLRRERQRFVVIDVNQASLGLAEAAGDLFVPGNAADDRVLERAGIARAQGLITAVDSDAENVYVVLSARGLRPDLMIIARATSEDAVKKLERAGANHVLSPYAIAGRRMAMLAIRPTTVELVETLLNTGREQLMLEEIDVAPPSPLVEMTMRAFRQRYPQGPFIVAIRHDGRLAAAPADTDVLRVGDVVVLIGTPAQLRAVEGRV
jgi:voltage-gated potassium channel